LFKWIRGAEGGAERFVDLSADYAGGEICTTATEPEKACTLQHDSASWDLKWRMYFIQYLKGLLKGFNNS